MKFGFYMSTEGPTAQPDSVVRIAQEAERLGFDSLVLGDHIVFPNDIESAYPYTVSGEWSGGEGGEHLEQLTMLTFLAAVTERVRLVPSVMIVPYRNPLLAAKMLATLDVLSKGRLTLGIGVGWMEEEFAALDAPPFAERGAVTDEYLRAYKELWTSDNPSFDGKFCHFFQHTVPAQARPKTASADLGWRAESPGDAPGSDTGRRLASGRSHPSCDAGAGPARQRHGPAWRLR